MSSATLPAPARRRAATVRPTRAGTASWSAQRTPVRLTRRGRLVVVTLLAVVALLAVVVGSLRAVDATTQSSAPVVQHVTVAPGETLWQIAGRVAPYDDRRDTVDRIIELNGLRSAKVGAGQDLLVPARG